MKKEMDILVVSNDAVVSATLTQLAITKLNADVSIAETIAGAKTLLAGNPFDAIVACGTLPDGSAVQLLSVEGAADVPVVFVEAKADPARILEVVRQGAADVVCQPLDQNYLTKVLRRLVDARKVRNRERTRSARLRKLSSRLIKDRRELRNRVDLICCDIVQAYQRLAEKVVGHMEEIGPRETTATQDPTQN